VAIREGSVWKEGRERINYLRLIPGLYLEDKMN
jgi:hypothetical protein